MILWLHLYNCVVITSMMTSQDSKSMSILKIDVFPSILELRDSVDQKLKISEIFMAILLVYSISGITSGKQFVETGKWLPLWKFVSIKHTYNLTSDMKRSSQNMTIKYFSWWWRDRWHHMVASKFPSTFMFRRRWLREQVARAMSRQWIQIS